MTSALGSQTALVAVINEAAAGAKTSQSALIVVANDTPPFAAGARSSSTVLISVAYEYQIPVKLRMFDIHAIWGFPLFVERTGI